MRTLREDDLLTTIVDQMGYPEEEEFPIEWFLKEVDRVEVGMDVLKGVSERGCAVSLM